LPTLKIPDSKPIATKGMIRWTGRHCNLLPSGLAQQILDQGMRVVEGNGWLPLLIDDGRQHERVFRRPLDFGLRDTT